jgi:hypothetical protein
MKKCKNCKEIFVPINFNQKYCFSKECLKVWIETTNEKEWNKKKVQLKNNLKTNQELMKLAQVYFNKYIRFRDHGQNCISCNKEAKKENAGHYFSQGGHSAIRFDEDNVHLQCEHCNTYLSGNLLNYQIGIQKRIGVERLLELQAKAHLEKKWSKEELNEIIEIYKNKVKNVIY